MVCAVSLALPAGLHAETTAASGAVEITALPVTISQPGTYFLARDFSVTGNSTAISISVDNVTIDLNGHTITNASGSGSNAYGVVSSNSTYNNLSIRNGTLTGFFNGMVFSTNPTTSPFGVRIEDLHISHCVSHGIVLVARDAVIRRCRFDSMGTTGVSGSGQPTMLLYGSGIRVLDCDIGQITPSSASATCTGIYTIASDTFLQGNRINGVTTGISFANGTTGKYRDNLFGLSVTTPVSGGTDAGGNN